MYANRASGPGPSAFQLPSTSDRRDVTELPFDQFQRYQLVADLVNELRDGRPVKILDVGGRTALLRRFLPMDSITLVDLEPSTERDLVLGSGSCLPFQDNAFDVVTACDTLEHVPPLERDNFVRECSRVSSRWIILAGPYEHPRVDDAENLLLRFLRQKLKVQHRYLEEHAYHGLPDQDRVQAVLKESGAQSVASIGHGSIERWLALMCLSMYMDEDPPLRHFAKLFYRFYNEALYASDCSQSVYRHAVVACLQEASLPSQESLFGPPSSRDEAFKPFNGLVEELIAFDRERDVYDAERNRLLEVNNGLLGDLQGHRTEREWFERELELHGLEQERLKRELELHGVEQARLAKERDLHSAERERLERELERREREFERELKRRGLEKKRVENERDLHSAERERLQRELERRESELEQINRSAASLNDQLTEMSRDLTHLNLDATALAHLQTQLRQPKRALKHFLRTARDKYLIKINGAST